MAARQTVLITGASTGIGEACARHLADRGWKVFAGVRNPEAGARLAEGSNGAIDPVTLDVTDGSEIAAAVKYIDGQTGGVLGGLVNNAGIAVAGPVEYLEMDDWRRQFEVNVIGQVAMARACLPLIRAARQPGRIVFIGSIGGRIATPLLGPYSASKHAIEAIAETMRHEMRHAGIKVALIEPGAISTPMWDKGRQSADELEGELSKEAMERYGELVARVRKGVDKQASAAVPAEKVAIAVERALTRSRPRARTLVGPDAKVMGAVTRVLPDFARDALLRLATR